LTAIRLEVPDEILRSLDMAPATFAREVMTLAAVKLFELGKLSSGGAARLAGIERGEFLLALGVYQVAPFQTDGRGADARRCQRLTGFGWARPVGLSTT
jgi:predicted HTH domain antitoxin